MDERLHVSLTLENEPKDDIQFRPHIWSHKIRFLELGLHAWDNERVSNLCRRMGITPHVLCAACGLFTLKVDQYGVPDLSLDVSSIRKFWRDNRWPVYLAIAFDRLEARLDARPSCDTVSLMELLRESQDHG